MRSPLVVCYLVAVLVSRITSWDVRRETIVDLLVVACATQGYEASYERDVCHLGNQLMLVDIDGLGCKEECWYSWSGTYFM